MKNVDLILHRNPTKAQIKERSEKERFIRYFEETILQNVWTTEQKTDDYQNRLEGCMIVLQHKRKYESK